VTEAELALFRNPTKRSDGLRVPKQRTVGRYGERSRHQSIRLMHIPSGRCPSGKRFNSATLHAGSVVLITVVRPRMRHVRAH